MSRWLFQFFICSFAGWDESSDQSRQVLLVPWPIASMQVAGEPAWRSSVTQAPLPRPLPPLLPTFQGLAPCLLFSLEIAIPSFSGRGG